MLSLVSATVETAGHMNLVLLFGLIILGGTFGSCLFQKFLVFPAAAVNVLWEYKTRGPLIAAVIAGAHIQLSKMALANL